MMAVPHLHIHHQQDSHSHQPVEDAKDVDVLVYHLDKAS